MYGDGQQQYNGQPQPGFASPQMPRKQREKIPDEKLFFLGTFMAVAALVLGITAYVHITWIRIVVPGTDIVTKNDSRLQYYTRDRGLFYECADNSGDFQKSKIRMDAVHTSCFAIDYGKKTANNSVDYWYIISGRRTCAATFGISLGLQIIALLAVLKTVGQLCITSEVSQTTSLLEGIVSGIYGLGVILQMISYVMFHIFMDAEKHLSVKVLPNIYYNWDPIVKQKAIMYYSSMYGLGWGATGLLALTALLFNALWIRQREREIKLGIRGVSTQKFVDQSPNPYTMKPMAQTDSLPYNQSQMRRFDTGRDNQAYGQSAHKGSGYY